MTKSRYQLIGVYPYTEYPYHIPLYRSFKEINYLIEAERWVVEHAGELKSIQDADAQWFLSYAIKDMIIFGFKNRETAFKFKMTFQ
jgi:hypothetical protein